MVGITERAVGQIVSDLEEAGYITRSRDGRRNRYEVHEELPLRHPQHRHHTVGELIRFLQAPASPVTGVSDEPPAATDRGDGADVSH